MQQPEEEKGVFLLAVLRCWIHPVVLRVSHPSHSPAIHDSRVCPAPGKPRRMLASSWCPCLRAAQMRREVPRSKQLPRIRARCCPRSPLLLSCPQSPSTRPARSRITPAFRSRPCGKRPPWECSFRRPGAAGSAGERQRGLHRNTHGEGRRCRGCWGGCAAEGLQEQLRCSQGSVRLSPSCGIAGPFGGERGRDGPDGPGAAGASAAPPRAQRAPCRRRAATAPRPDSAASAGQDRARPAPPRSVLALPHRHTLVFIPKARPPLEGNGDHWKGA